MALFASCFLVYTNHTRSQTSSSTILFFWPLYFLGLAVWARTLLLIDPHAPHIQLLLALRSGVAVSGLASFALELVAPKFESIDADEETLDEGHVVNPIETANIFSKWTFMYMTPLLKKGASTIINDQDLPSLVKDDQAIQLAQKLESGMAKQ